jgi:hypothetical protein
VTELSMTQIIDGGVSPRRKMCAQCGITKLMTGFKKSTASDGSSYRQDICKACHQIEFEKRVAERARTKAAQLLAYHRPKILIHHTAKELLSRPKKEIIWSHIHWTEQQLADLAVLVEAKAPLPKIANILQRTEESVIDKAGSLHLSLAGITKPRKPKLIVKPRAPLLAFPFISSVKPSNADLMRVNALIPHAWPEWKRADICQAIMLALYEGHITLTEFEANRANLKWFATQYARSQTPYQEIIISDESGDDERPYYDRTSSFTSASQEDEIYALEIALRRPLALARKASAE